MEEMRPVYR